MQINTYLAGLPIYSMYVLIATEEDVHAEAVGAMLNGLGFKHITRARSGPEVLSFSKENGYHLLLVDGAIPGKDGYEVIDELRHGTDSPYAEVPMILLETSREASAVQRAIGVGASHYMIKPFNQVALRERIMAVFANKTRSIYDAHKRNGKQQQVAAMVSPPAAAAPQAAAEIA